MEDRSTYITIGSKEYELVFTTYATKQVSKKYGDLRKLGDALETKALEESLDDIVWLVTLLANQGIMRHNMYNHTNEPLLKEEEVEILTSPGDYIDYNKAIQEAIVKGTKRFVTSEEKN